MESEFKIFRCCAGTYCNSGRSVMRPAHSFSPNRTCAVTQKNSQERETTRNTGRNSRGLPRVRIPGIGGSLNHIRQVQDSRMCLAISKKVSHLAAESQRLIGGDAAPGDTLACGG